jgi:hypothetical protein
MSSDRLNKPLFTLLRDSVIQNSFFGPIACYLNHSVNRDYSNSSVNGGVLNAPVLFIEARFDYILGTSSPCKFKRFSTSSQVCLNGIMTIISDRSQVCSTRSRYSIMVASSLGAGSRRRRLACPGVISGSKDFLLIRVMDSGDRRNSEGDISAASLPGFGCKMYCKVNHCYCCR